MLLIKPLEHLKMVFTKIMTHSNKLQDTPDVVNTDNKKINQIMLKHDGRKDKKLRTKMKN